MPFTFHTDPGHGWLEVSIRDVQALGLHSLDFTHYSYVSHDGTKLYLEEDCDASHFLQAYKAKYGQEAIVHERNVNRDSFIRSLPNNY